MSSAGWKYGEPVQSGSALFPAYPQATTACLGAIVVMQIVNVFLCRSERRPFWAFGLFRNRLILAGLAIEVGLMAVIGYTPLGNAIFGTAPLAPSVWLSVVPFALAMLVLEELRKWHIRQKDRATHGRGAAMP